MRLFLENFADARPRQDRVPAPLPLTRAKSFLFHPPTRRTLQARAPASEPPPAWGDTLTHGAIITSFASMATTTTKWPTPMVRRPWEALVPIRLRWESSDGRVVRTKRSGPTGITFTRTRQPAFN